MSLKIFNSDYFEELCLAADAKIRKRQHHNIHESFTDPCQRLFNAICVGSYIRPHRHLASLGYEMFIGICGVMVLVTFDDQGNLVRAVGIGDGGTRGSQVSVAEIQAGTWHTVIALQPRSVLLEVKAGPFDPNQSKDYPVWAPEEGSPEAAQYLKKITDSAREFMAA